MTRRFTRILAAFALLVFMMPSLAGWGQSSTWSHEFVLGDSYTNNSVTVNGATWTISTSQPVGTPSISFGNMQKKYALKFGSSGTNYFPTITLTTDYFTNYNVQSVTVNICNNGTKEGTLTVVQGSTTIGTDSKTFAQTWTDLTANTNTGSGGQLSISYTVAQACGIHSITVTYSTGSSATATNTTITIPTNFNTDVYTSTTAGQLTATVTYDDNGTPTNVPNASVTWGSSDEDVATVDANGNVTLVAAGTTNITATFAGNDDYATSYGTYVLEVTSSAPYVQPNPVVINMNYQWLGSTNGGNLNANQLPVVKVDDNLTTTIEKGTSSTNPRGDSDYIRLYNGSTLTFDAPEGYVMTSIEFTTGGSNTWNAPSVSTGTLSSKTWTGNAESVVFTMTGSCFISNATITLAAPASLHTLTATMSHVAEFYVFVGDNTNPIVFDDNNQAQVRAGATVGVSIATMEDCFIFGSLTVNGSSEGVTQEDPNDPYFTFEMPEGNATIDVISSAAGQYTLTVGTLEHVTLELTAGEDSEPVQLTGNSADLCVGIHVTVIATAAQGYTSPTLSVVDGNNQPIEVIIEGENTFSFTMPASNVTITATAVEAPIAATYSLVTSADQLVAGKSYIIVSTKSDGSYVAMGSKHSSDYRLSTPVIHNSDNTITGNDQVREVVLGGSTGNWTFYESTDNAYLKGYNGGSLYNYTPDQSNTLDDACYWTIIMEDGYAKIESNKYNTSNDYSNDYYIMYNPSQPRFACYKGTQNWTYLYVKNETTPAGIPLDIERGQWYLIASPVGNVDIDDVDNLTSGNHGLYSFDQTGGNDGKEWRNYKAGAFSQLQAGKGYLYINQEGCTLTFTGTAYSTPDGSATFPIDYYTSNPTTSFRGLNLVGNPFNEDAAINLPFYKMNATTGEIEAASGLVHPMEGVFVVASENVNSVTFQTGIGYGGGDEKFSLNLTQNRGNVIDRAIVRFDEGGQLPKVQLFENSTKIYISQNGKDYAVVCSEGQGELPVNFRASENGTYTLSMDVENMDMNYLHLIDNMTGMDVDLLQTPSYTFEAKVNDYESRFRLVFAANNNNEDGPSTGSGTFAFYSNGNWIINNAGEATLQVVDLTGRILSSETVNGSVSKTINAVPGVYMLRLINGENVNVQKIVVR